MLDNVVQVKGKLVMDRWGPFLFQVQGVNPAERRKIADYIRPFYPLEPVDLTTGYPDYRGLDDVDFCASLYLTQSEQVQELYVCIMSPHKLVAGSVSLPRGEIEITIRGEFYCQSVGPMNLKFRGSNPAEQKRLLEWIKEYMPVGKRGESFNIEDNFGRGSLKMWFSNEKQTEADIKIGVMPSIQFIRSARSQYSG